MSAPDTGIAGVMRRYHGGSAKKRSRWLQKCENNTLQRDTARARPKPPAAESEEASTVRHGEETVSANGNTKLQTLVSKLIYFQEAADILVPPGAVDFLFIYLFLPGCTRRNLLFLDLNCQQAD